MYTNNRQLFLCIFIFIIAVGTIKSAENDSSKNLHCLIIPGQNGMGGQNVQNLKIIPEDAQFHWVATPEKLPDLGQGQCKKHLAQKLRPLQQADNNNIIIYGVSQGTATAINEVSENPKNVSCLILESVLGSGNSAIHHTVNNVILPDIGLSGFKNISGSYYILPHIARIHYPFYFPTGQQAIHSVKNIPNDMMIIIIHAQYDTQLSVTDAEALYYQLRIQGNNNTYLIIKEESAHLQLLGFNPDGYSMQDHNDIVFIRKLLHGQEIDEIRKKCYQPDPAQFKKSYDDLIIREQRIRTMSSCTWAASVIGATLMAEYMWARYQ